MPDALPDPRPDPVTLKPGWLADDVRKAAERVAEWTAPTLPKPPIARPRPALAFSSRDLTDGAVTTAVRATRETIAAAIS